MKLAITGFADRKKIVAIKGFRAAMLGDLNTSKRVMDQVGAGATVTWDLAAGADSGWVIQTLREHGVSAHLEDETPAPLASGRLVDVLREYHPSLTVGALVGMLESTEEMARTGVLVIGGEW